jgi:agmatinase
MGDREKTFKNIEGKIKDILRAGSTPISIGGDHSITVPIVKAMLEEGVEPLILHFDAHYDNLPSYLGDKYARSSPIRRIIEDLQVDPQNIIQIGIRGPRNSPEGRKYAEEMGISVYDVWSLKKKGFEELLEDIFKRAKNTDGVYITICMDVLDSSVAPAAAGDPLGLSSFELIETLMKIVSKVKMLGMDIVEIYPPLDVRNMTTHLAIWIILYTLAAMKK